MDTALGQLTNVALSNTLSAHIFSQTSYKSRMKSIDDAPSHKKAKSMSMANEDEPKSSSDTNSQSLDSLWINYDSKQFGNLEKNFPVPKFQRTSTTPYNASVSIPKPAFIRSTSVGSSINGSFYKLDASKLSGQDSWLRNVTIEDRKRVRAKISSAYRNNSKSIEELLDIIASIDEELVFHSSSNRFEYYKSGLKFEERISKKRDEIISCRKIDYIDESTVSSIDDDK